MTVQHPFPRSASDLPYARTTLLDSYRQAVGYPHTVGRADTPAGGTVRRA